MKDFVTHIKDALAEGKPLPRIADEIGISYQVIRRVMRGSNKLQLHHREMIQRWIERREITK